MFEDPLAQGADLPVVEDPGGAEACFDRAAALSEDALRWLDAELDEAGGAPEIPANALVALKSAAAYLRLGLHLAPEMLEMHRRYQQTLFMLADATGNRAYLNRLIYEYQQFYEDQGQSADFACLAANALLAAAPPSSEGPEAEKRLERARELLTRAHEQDPTNFWVARQLGQMAMDARQPDVAIPYLEQAATHATDSRSPAELDALFLLALAYTESGRWQAALEAIEAYVALAPNPGMDAYLFWASLLFEHGYYETAKHLLIAQLPAQYAADERLRHMALLGDIYRAEEDWVRADQAYSRFLEYHDDPEVERRLAEVRRHRFGDRDEASHPDAGREEDS